MAAFLVLGHTLAAHTLAALALAAPLIQCTQHPLLPPCPPPCPAVHAALRREVGSHGQAGECLGTSEKCPTPLSWRAPRYLRASAILARPMLSHAAPLQMLRRYWAAYPEGREAAPAETAERIMVFQRGAEVVRHAGTCSW